MIQDQATIPIPKAKRHRPKLRSGLQLKH